MVSQTYIIESKKMHGHYAKRQVSGDAPKMHSPAFAQVCIFGPKGT